MKMPAVYLRSPLELEEVAQLKKEFPYYKFYTDEHFKDSLDPDQLWGEVEVLLGEQLNSEELKKAASLKWVHLPCSTLNHICFDQITLRENILVTVTQERHAHHVAEWAMACFLAFAKQLFWWKEHQDKESHAQRKAQLWSHHKKTWLQIGLDEESQELAKGAKELGCQVWGINERGSFNPHCHKVYTPKELHSLLPAADVVCLYARRKMAESFSLTKEELSLMKQDSILLLFCSREEVDQEALYYLFQEGRFRGVAIDTHDQQLLRALHPLRESPKILLTPHVSSYPHVKDTQMLRLFRHNLRQFMHDNIQDMHLLVR